MSSTSTEAKRASQPITDDFIAMIRRDSNRGGYSYSGRQLRRIADALEAGITRDAGLRTWHAARLAEKDAATAALAAPSDVKLQQAWSDARTARVTAEAALAELAEGLSASPPYPRGGAEK